MEHPVLSFLLKYLTDTHINYLLTDGADIDLSSLDLGLRNSILKVMDTTPSDTISALHPHSIYHIIDYYECSYSFFQFPDKSQLLFIGPYLSRELTESDIRRLMNSLQIPEDLFLQLSDYYSGLPCLPEKNFFFSLLRHLYAFIFETSHPFSRFVDLRMLESQDAFLEKHEYQVPKDPILSMHMLEERYHIEDKLLDAVSRGNTAKALSVYETMGSIRFAARTTDELRNRKNFMLTFNSLLRRTAYEAGVHPFYIDAVSSNYASLLEQSSSIREITDITPYMIQSYCRLVEDRSMVSYSEPIRQILVTIDASLTGDLSLKRFANELFLNTSYLSNLFKKEVGVTLTDYVNKNRIEYAKKLLKSTTLSIQDIAVRSGISDIHYFTRLFRRETGMSPRDFRNQ